MNGGGSDDNLILLLADLISEDVGVDRETTRMLLRGEDTGDGTMGEAALDDLIHIMAELHYAAFYGEAGSVYRYTAHLSSDYTIFEGTESREWLEAAREIDPSESGIAALIRDTIRDNEPGEEEA